MVWSELPIGGNANDLFVSINSFETWLKMAKNWICLPPSGISSRPIFPWVYWSLWSVQNKLVFEKKNLSAKESLSKAIRDAHEWQHVQTQHTEQRRRTVAPQPTPLSPDTLVVFTDAAWDKESKRAGLRWFLLKAVNNIPSHNSTSVSFVLGLNGGNLITPRSYSPSR